MNLSIKKDKRGRGFHFHKAPEIKKIVETKSIAFVDITKECGEGKMFARNYLSIEYRVMEFAGYDFTYLNI